MRDLPDIFLPRASLESNFIRLRIIKFFRLIISEAYQYVNTARPIANFK